MGLSRYLSALRRRIREFFSDDDLEPDTTIDRSVGVVSPYEQLGLGTEWSSRPQRAVRDAFVFSRIALARRTTVGLYYPDFRVLLIRNPDTGGPGRYFQWQAHPTDKGHPIFGDWTGAGKSLFGLFDGDNACFTLFGDEQAAAPIAFFHFGPPEMGWIPLAGDWDGDGRSGVGLYDPVSGFFMLRNELIGAPPEIEFSFGPANQGWLPIAGDWNGQGYDKVGVYDPVTGLFILAADHNRNEYRRIETKPPSKTWKPVAGDWLDMGYDSLGLFDPDSNGFHLLEAGPGGWGEAMFQFGISGVEGLPVAVRWDADAVQELSLTNLQHESLNKKEGPHA